MLTVPLSERHGWLPDLDAFDAWDEIALYWTCYPNNPTGAVAPLSFYEELAARAREHGFLLCSDEAYSELWFDEPPVSALQLADRENVVVFNTLSKRSSMTGYRSGFVCAPRAICDALGAFRPTVGTAPQEFVQRASVAAWSDDAHVEEVRALYARKRALLLPALEERGLRLAGSAATFYLWLDVGGPAEPFARRLLEHGIVVAPGSFFGPAGEGYVRFALVPTEAECARAAEIIRECPVSDAEPSSPPSTGARYGLQSPTATSGASTPTSRRRSSTTSACGGWSRVRWGRSSTTTRSR